MTNDECRAEALKRVEKSDRLLATIGVVCAETRRTEDQVYREIVHLRQTAAVFAALAGPIDG